MFLQLAAKADIVSPWHRRCVSPSDLSQRSNTGIRIDIVCAQKRGVCGSNDFKRSRWNWVQNQLDTNLEKFGLFALAIVLFAIGGSIYGWCLFDFASFGRGTPAPIDPPKKLVTQGLYSYSRNPMYVGVLTLIFGWAVLYRRRGVVVYALVVAVCFYSFCLILRRADPAEAVWCRLRTLPPGGSSMAIPLNATALTSTSSTQGGRT